jgi:hypothetical protein
MAIKFDIRLTIYISEIAHLFHFFQIAVFVENNSLKKSGSAMLQGVPLKTGPLERRQ